MVYFTGDGKIVYDDYPIPPTHETQMQWNAGSSNRVTSQSQIDAYGQYISGLNAVPDDPSLLYPNGLNPNDVKPATKDIILFNDEKVPIDIMTDLIFENIGGQELINIARSDTVNGQNIIYQPIKNLARIQQEYNPNNIIALQSTSDKYFQNFAIKLNNKIPNIGNGPGGANVYIDPENGDLVIETVNLEEDEQVEAQITTSGTIYEAEL